ncbi:MAG: nucleotidyltransferase domain-containing protein [Candidatus Nanoarchaeia archaeon]|nr:nucleotidyltransferase domain-containing protein [Candidatus Nanoarchaeia archaeon]
MKQIILEQFLNYPQEDFSARGLSRKLNINHVTILKYLNILKKENLIKTKITTLYPVYCANTSSNKYMFEKKQHIQKQILDSNLLQQLISTCNPDCIILFGSCAKGNYTENSDIDIFVQSSNKEINLASFEKKLNHKINLLFEPNIRKLSGELANNIINGIILYGYIKVF